MKPVIYIDPQTQLMQEKASNPNHSAWVSANAGSGKTTVLSRRVVRLLLSGTNPSRILCLTFTKAAAGEMSNRVFSLLGEWAVLPQNDLADVLTDIQGERPTSGQVETARTLFAKALETPGGLKIQTIHAFCEALLHQFPLEANIPGSFTVMDDAQQDKLMADARRSVVLQSVKDLQSKIASALRTVMDFAGDTALEKAFDEIIDKRDELSQWLARCGGPEHAENQSRDQFGFGRDEKATDLNKAALDGCSFTNEQFQLLFSLGQPHLSPKETDRKLAERIEAYFAADTIKTKWQKLLEIFTTGGKARSAARLATKEVQAEIPNFVELVEAETSRVIAENRRINTLNQIENTTALLIIAQAIIEEYNRLKRRAGLLDFDDLISKSAELLTRKSARSWVLYKLDLGLDHVLLDEAQDTSPQQWRIIDALVDEFFSGQSARLVNRTIFAVGDEKQSIYSFQGARPKQFQMQRNRYQKMIAGSGKAFETVNLNLSFRSTPDVLGAVDRVFENPRHADGITFEEKPQPHVAARRNDPGQVDVWPLELPEKQEDPTDWETPQEAAEISHQAIRLADRMAGQIASWIGKERLEASGKLITAGDIIVLVRARDRFMLALNRKLKDLGIDVAGADRLVLTGHIAIKDLMALGQVMITPEDDLSLACVLKSPLIGLDEDQLYHLSRYRLRPQGEISLHQALMSLKDDPQYRDTCETLLKWQGKAKLLPLFEFFAQVLGVDGRLKRIYSRLGHEAEDVLDAFLDAALMHDEAGIPGMQGFLESLSRDTPEIKRDMDQTIGAVRVMTVHAAKGLEAPVVFLVDKCSPAFSSGHAPALYKWNNDGLDGYLWNPSSDDHGDETLSLQQDIKLIAHQEYRRLLYVGMTRAKDRLIVCGYHNGRKLPDPNWHAMVSDSLEADWTDVRDQDDNLLWHSWKAPDSPVAQPVHRDEEIDLSSKTAASLPGWIGHHLPREYALPKPLNPSGANAFIDKGLVYESKVPSLIDGAPAVGSEETHAQRGTALHKLLQVLPDVEEASQRRTAEHYLQSTLTRTSADERHLLIDAVFNVINSPDLQDCFSPATSRAEVPIMGRVDLRQGPKPVSGTIDRLAVLDDEVIIVDYKTSAYIPRNLADISPDYIIQMALYDHLVSRLYRDKTVRSCLIWTHAPDGPKIFTLPKPQLEKAMDQIAQL